jgi:hypothetical protein
LHWLKDAKQVPSNGFSAWMYPDLLANGLSTVCEDFEVDKVNKLGEVGH